MKTLYLGFFFSLISLCSFAQQNKTPMILVQFSDSVYFNDYCHKPFLLTSGDTISESFTTFLIKRNIVPSKLVRLESGNKVDLAAADSLLIFNIYYRNQNDKCRKFRYFIYSPDIFVLMKDGSKSFIAVPFDNEPIERVPAETIRAYKTFLETLLISKK